jgi:hypothetical protein
MNAELRMQCYSSNGELYLKKGHVGLYSTFMYSIILLFSYSFRLCEFPASPPFPLRKKKPVDRSFLLGEGRQTQTLRIGF